MSMVGFPLLLIPLAIYNIIVFLMPGVSFAEPLVTLTLMSGARVAGDAERCAARARHRVAAARGHQGRASRREISHRSSAVADRLRRLRRRNFCCGRGLRSSTYFLLTLLALVDFLSGIALRARRGMQTAPAAAVARRATQKADVQADAKTDVHPAEPRFEPEPAPSPAPAPSARPRRRRRRRSRESVLLDHPEPKVVQPAVVASEPSPHPAVAASEPNRSSPAREPGRRWLRPSCNRATVRRPHPRRRSADPSDDLPRPACLRPCTFGA